MAMVAVFTVYAESENPASGVTFVARDVLDLKRAPVPVTLNVPATLVLADLLLAFLDASVATGDAVPGVAPGHVIPELTHEEVA